MIFTNIAQALYSSIAYKVLAVNLMLGEASDLSRQLNLPIETPIQQTNATEIYVAPPRINTFGGSIRLRDFAFGFDKGVLHSVERLERRELNPSAAHAPIRDTAEATRIARVWLTRVSVDLRKLDSEATPTCERIVSREPRLTRNQKETKSTSFRVTWARRGERPNHAASRSAAEVELTATGELLSLRVGDYSLSSRPIIRIAGAEEIARIPNEQLLPDLRRTGANVTNVLKLLSTPEEFQGATLSAMLREVQFLCRLFGVPASDTNSVLDYYIRPPRFGYGGHVALKSGVFYFDERGQFERFNRSADVATIDGGLKETRSNSGPASTNIALTLARNFIATFPVDQHLLASAEMFVVPLAGDAESDLPDCRVSWGEGATTKLRLLVSTPTRKLTSVEIGDPAVWLRAPLAITNWSAATNEISGGKPKRAPSP